MPPIVWAIFISSWGGSIAPPIAGWPILREHPDTDLIAGFAVGEGRSGALPRGPPGRIRAESMPSWPIDTATRRSRSGARRPRRGSCSLASGRRAMGRRPGQPESARAGGSAGPAARGDGRPRLAIAVRRIGRSRHDAPGADPVGIQFAECRRAGRDGRRHDALRQLLRAYFRGRLEERQDALAVGVVSSSRSCWRSKIWPACSIPAGSRSWPRASTSGPWPAT